MNRESRRDKGQHSTSYRVFLTFCITLCLLTITSAAVVQYIYRGGFDANFLGTMKAMVPFGSEEGTEPKVSKDNRKPGVYTIVIAGTDYDGTRTDTILLATVDTKRDTVSLLSIPRDTRAFMESGAVHKINAAHNKGSARMMTEISYTVGFMPDHYCVLDFTAFKNIIDAVDGVDVEVKRDMYYIADDMVIDLREGYQTLSGEQALMYMRYRKGYADADIGRIGAQQELYLALAEKLMSAQTVFKAPKLARVFYNDVETSMSLGEVIWLGTRLIGMKSSSLSLDMIPGYIDGADYVVDPGKAIPLINEKYNPFTIPITELNTAK